MLPRPAASKTNNSERDKIPGARGNPAQVDIKRANEVKDRN